MITRPYWIEKIEDAWSKVPIAWLSGVRRVGKTTLSRSFANAEYCNCDLPSVARRLEEPEQFFSAIKSPTVIFDEIHQLGDPSRILKIGADAYPHLRILATGSSTLAASAKFRDTLTGRKRTIHMLPVLAEELHTFGIADIQTRLLRGGLPDALLADVLDESLYSEWMDSYFARDVQELFRVEKRAGFLRLLQLLLLNSGSVTEITGLAKHSGLTRPTVMNYIDVFQATQAMTVLSPYSAGGRREIIAQKKIYGFDTGFVAFTRGWNELSSEDCGILWEHLVLEALQSFVDESKLHYWRDQQHREVDFVVPNGRDAVDAIECKWSAAAFDTKGLRAFRENYPNGRNFLVTPEQGEPYQKSVNGLAVTVATAAHLRQLV